MEPHCLTASARRAAPIVAAWLTAVAFSAAATEITLTPAQDTSLYAGNGLETHSDGQGDYLWLAVTAGGVNRRILLKFDTSVIPVGATVTQATLSIYESRARDEHATSAHRMLRSWGEGASNGGGQGEGAPAAVGDATWLHAFFPDVFWSRPGGDYRPAPSATVTVGFPGQFYDWGPSATLRADVQTWVDDPATNHGWILIGQEQGPQNAKRFESRNNSVAANRPRLRIVYELPADAEVPLPAWVLAVLALGLGWRLKDRMARTLV